MYLKIKIAKNTRNEGIVSFNKTIYRFGVFYLSLRKMFSFYLL